MLVEKARHWPMLRRCSRRTGSSGPASRTLRKHPGLGRRLGAPAACSTCGRSTPRPTSAVPRPRGRGRDHRPPGYMLGWLEPQPASSGPRGGLASGAWRSSSRTKARDRRDHRRGGRAAAAVPVRLRRRYKACHGAAAGAAAFVARPFEGLRGGARPGRAARAGAAATAPLTVSASARRVLLCSLLPMAAPAMVRDTARSGWACRCSTSSATRRATSAAVLEKALATAEAGVVGPHRPARRPAPASRTWSPTSRSR